jgi:hypothetical protein
MEAFRAQELLLQRATEGLSDHEAAELAALGADDDFSFDLAAAAVDIATIQAEELPAGVADKILIAAGVRPQQAMPSTLAGVMPARPIQSGSSTALPAYEQPPVREAPIIPITRKRSSAVVAWAAAAAALAFAIGSFIWASGRKPDGGGVVTAPTLSEQRTALLAVADVKTLAWSAIDDPASKNAKGDVVWSPSKQEGYMRFVGLAPNDPKITQYQLWIFDKNRDEKYPVDGGVFDITADGEVIVKIDARLFVTEPVLWAVTVEKPGGVVVSARERIVVVAKPG